MSHFDLSKSIGKKPEELGSTYPNPELHGFLPFRGLEVPLMVLQSKVFLVVLLQRCSPFLSKKRTFIRRIKEVFRSKSDAVDFDDLVDDKGRFFINKCGGTVDVQKGYRRNEHRQRVGSVGSIRNYSSRRHEIVHQNSVSRTTQSDLMFASEIRRYKSWEWLTLATDCAFGTNIDYSFHFVKLCN